MNAEQFHDALTLLSPDLVAEADESRRHTKSSRGWKPLVAFAACLLLVLGMGWFRMAALNHSAASESAVEMAVAEAAPVEEAACGTVREDVTLDTTRPFWESVTIATPDSVLSAVNRSTQPTLTLLTREEDWTAYRSSTTLELDALTDAVDISRLAEEDLLLIYLPAQTATVTDVTSAESIWQVSLSDGTDSTGSTIALWLPKGMIVSTEEIAILWETE